MFRCSTAKNNKIYVESRVAFKGFMNKRMNLLQRSLCSKTPKNNRLQDILWKPNDEFQPTEKWNGLSHKMQAMRRICYVSSLNVLRPTPLMVVG